MWYIIAAIIIIFAGRYLFAWYFGISEIIHNLEEINKKLDNLVKK